MAGNNSIQILRGNNVKSTAASEVLLDGQPLYDRTTGYLYVGEGNTVANTQAVNAHYANSAGSASSATTAQQANAVKGYLYFNGSGRNDSWNGSATEVVYAPTSLGTRGQVWGMINSNRAGWIDQTEIPGTIEHANTADVAYEVSGSNVAGTVANANFATTAGKVAHSFKVNVNGTTYTYNGSNVDIDILDDNPVVTLSKTTEPGAIVYTNSTGRINWLSHPGVSGSVLTSGSNFPTWRTFPKLYNIEIGGVLVVLYPGQGAVDEIENSIQLGNDIVISGHNRTNPVRVYGFSIPNHQAGEFISSMYCDNNNIYFCRLNGAIAHTYGRTQEITIHKIYGFAEY